MKILYRVAIVSLDPPRPHPYHYDFAASNPHYAVREAVAMAGRRGDLPRGWKKLRLEVSR